MTSFLFDEEFNDLRKLMERLLPPNAIKKAILEGTLKGRWYIHEIDEPEMKGFLIQGHIKPNQETGLRIPYNSLNRRWRPPQPSRLQSPNNVERGSNEPLVDVFEGLHEVKVYVELPLEEKNDIRLNVVEGGVEVKTKSFYKLIKVPANLDLDKASSTHKNRVLEVRIPKKKAFPRKGKQQIPIE